MKRVLILRPLNISDSCFLAEYAAECESLSGNSEISKIERRLRQRFEDPNYVGVIALVDNEPIGFQDGIIVNQSLELNEIYVQERHRSQGIGGKLIKEIIAIARSRDIRKVIYHTEADNVAMQNLGTKMGFELKRLSYEKEL